MLYHSIQHTGETSIWYKAVHKTKKGFVSDYDKDYAYIIGNEHTEAIDDDVTRDCSIGIHVAPLYWALGFGSAWADLAILEVEVNNADIIVPEYSNGKVRTSRIKVLREVPLGECGVYGKILAKKRRKQET